MNKDLIVSRVLEELRAQADGSDTVAGKPRIVTPAGYGVATCGLTEFVGSTPYGDSLGLVIANLDPSLHEAMGLDKKYRSVGIVSSRSGGGPQSLAADEAVKASNVELVKFEFSNDTKGGGGHGSMLLFGAEEVSDARRAVEITLESLEWTFGGVVGNANSFIEVQWTARASHVLTKYMHADYGKAWGLINGCPPSVGFLMADAALKAADVTLKSYVSPDGGSNVGYTGEYAIYISGDSGAVKQAILTARDVGIQLLRTMGEEPVPTGKPYY